MSDVEEVTSTPTELLATGRRNLAVRDYFGAVEALARACELLAKEHGDSADECGDAYLWYGKALLGLSREESGVLGGRLPGSGDADAEEDEEEQEENGENGEEHNGKTEAKPEKPESDEGVKKIEAESTTPDVEPGSSTSNDKPGPSNGDAADQSVADLENEDVDNLQLAWEMLDLARSILIRRLERAGDAAARAQLAEVHLALGEVALESETYDKAVTDMQSCLEIQKELYPSDDRRIAETHYQIGLANSLASSFDDAITHFKNAANILETRIKTLENPTAAKNDATVKKHSTADQSYSVEGEIKELKELLPEIQEKIQDMMDYKTEVRPCDCLEETRKMLRDIIIKEKKRCAIDCQLETIKRVRETLCPSSESSSTNGAGSSSEAKPKAASDISHLIKRKRKSSEGDAGASAPKRVNT